ncbi:MAG: electron transport complex subunit RsxE, partial [Candidatus Latescibacterota bacterium]
MERREEVSRRPWYQEYLKGLWEENPIFRMLLGMCPTLAVTTSAVNGLSMGLATTFVLTSTSLVVSIIRKLVPNQVRIATFTIIIATFVTVADLFLKAK